jgi:hypothetical protein
MFTKKIAKSGTRNKRMRMDRIGSLFCRATPMSTAMPAIPNCMIVFWTCKARSDSSLKLLYSLRAAVSHLVTSLSSVRMVAEVSKLPCGSSRRKALPTRVRYIASPYRCGSRPAQSGTGDPYQGPHRGAAGRGRPPEAAARRAGLEFVEKLLTTSLTSTDATERNAGMLRVPYRRIAGRAG